jgi:hypothetical protein
VRTNLVRHPIQTGGVTLRGSNVTIPHYKSNKGLSGGSYIVAANTREEKNVILSREDLAGILDANGRNVSHDKNVNHTQYFYAGM